MMEKNIMKAIHLKAYGTPEEVLQLVEIEKPKGPGTGEVLIEMEFAPVNLVDLLLAMGVYLVRPELPTVIGGEGVGKIIAVGNGVENVKIGDRVTLPFGSYAWTQQLIAPADGLFVIDSNIDIKQAAMLSINPPTAVLLLNEYVPLQAGDWVVFNAANSALGQAIIAVAKSKGIKTLGIVRRFEAVQPLLEIGANVILVDGPEITEQIKHATGGADIRLGLDAVGGEATNTLSKVLGMNSHLVVYALMSQQPIIINQADLIFKNMKVHGFWMYYPEYISKLTDAMKVSEKLIASGDLNVKIADIYPLSEFKEAIAQSFKGGKVLLDIQSNR
jgi:NADPH:quinone reductase-like Zn-dependent oxidoreductase